MNGRCTSPDQALADAVAEVRGIYDDLGARPVQRNCELRTGCCRFRLTGLTPYLTRGEALVAAAAVRAGGRTSLAKPRDGACPLLDEQGACRIYEARPLGCRTHFCHAAGGMIPRRQVLDLIRRLEEVDRRLGGDGPQALPVAVQQALARLAGRTSVKGVPRSARRAGPAQ